MPNNKHLTLDDRSYIHTGLNAGHSFCRIACHLDKDPSSVSKEVRLNRIRLSTGAVGRIPNKCVNKKGCTVRGLCGKYDCRVAFCSYCKTCNTICQEFKEERCNLLSKPPYVCNGCNQMHRCVLTKYVYQARPADSSYRTRLSECRSGISYSEEELRYMDEVITPLVKKKQSIHHICITQADKVLCSERTVYKLIGQNVLTARNIDLPRKVRYRPRLNYKPFKVDRNCREGRTYEDFQKYIGEHPDTSIVQTDTVEGRKGGKVILTVFFTQSDLMLMHLRDHNTSQSVIDIFNTLDETLGREAFEKLFPVILADGGSEFSNPRAIEYDADGQLRTKLFYCDPSSPYQKPEIEKSHEFIRMVLPKGRSFDDLTQNDVDMLACHINSLIRKKLNERSPITTFSFFHGDSTLRKLGLQAIPPDAVTLSPALLAASKEVSQHDLLP